MPCVLLSPSDHFYMVLLWNIIFTTTTYSIIYFKSFVFLFPFPSPNGAQGNKATQIKYNIIVFCVSGEVTL